MEMNKRITSDWYVGWLVGWLVGAFARTPHHMHPYRYIVQLRDKFMQHGGNGDKEMLNTWKKLRVFANARVPNMVTFTEFDKGLKVRRE